MRKEGCWAPDKKRKKKKHRREGMKATDTSEVVHLTFNAVGSRH